MKQAEVCGSLCSICVRTYNGGPVQEVMHERGTVLYCAIERVAAPRISYVPVFHGAARFSRALVFMTCNCELKPLPRT